MVMSDYNKVMKFHEKLVNVCKEHNVVIWTAQQPQRKFSGHTRLMQLKPHTGKGRKIDSIFIDNSNLIK
jgi:hypothetical protein